jgi:hypothetical protein
MNPSLVDKPIGSQLSYAAAVFAAKRRLVDAGLGAKEVERRVTLATQYSRVVMQVLVSLIVLLSAVYLLVTGNEPSQKLASGLIGTVVGYWLR